MNVREAAKLLGVSVGTVYSLAAPRGPIQCFRPVAGRIVFDEADILAYRESCRCRSAGTTVCPFGHRFESCPHQRHQVCGLQPLRKPPT